jgi:hypothetical protein
VTEAMVGMTAARAAAPSRITHLPFYTPQILLDDISWIPQSRAGFGWPDFTDVPLGEAQAAWRVQLRDAAGPVAQADVAVPFWSVPDRSGPLWLDVMQIGATLGQSATLFIP